jgi:hypothetical protein
MTELDRAIAAAVREAAIHGATHADIRQLVAQLRQRAADDKADNGERMTVPTDDPKPPEAA